MCAGCVTMKSLLLRSVDIRRFYIFSCTRNYNRPYIHLYLTHLISSISFPTIKSQNKVSHRSLSIFFPLVLIVISNQAEALGFGILSSMAFSNCGLKFIHLKWGPVISHEGIKWH